MNCKSLISSEFPLLSLQDSGDKALRLMNEYRVFHLPLIERDNYLALISEDDILDWNTPEEALSSAEFLTFRPAVFEGSHPYEAVRIAKEFNLSVLPVIDAQHHFAGVITIEGLFNFLTDNNAIKSNGSILIFEMEQRNYSLSEIARICETNSINILSLALKNIDEQGMIWVTIKVNSTDIQALVSTFERFNYTIIEMYSTDFTKEDVQQNYDMLMHYINL